ncbi:neural-cadherin-like [Macrosteles quadrilineatus]|uniref:neural-cadherin-like n=1 Tax=Macrosteles quadrilineatus TaxID=74068 RepID=UPI0023E1BB26|nr:neural-cadherin-like [Macrosteles quadrilineatus]
MVDPLKVLWVLTNSTYLVSKFIRLGATDKNEYAPYFEKGVFELYIEENEEINHPLLSVASKDRKEATRVRYEITGGNIGGVFALGSKTGVLHLIRPLDYEAVQRYELRLAASDKNTASFATVIVHVKDVNDNPPLFERPTYRTQITEEDDRNLPKKVLQVIALDADKARPGDVVYSLTGQGVDPDNPINNKFDIGKTSGEIFVLKPLDRDEPQGKPQWRFTVFAQDEGGEGLVGYADVQINLKDINDNAPTFLQGLYHANVTENSTAGELVMTMKAVDYDDPEEGGNADILYSIEKNVVEEGTGLPIFEIDPLSGEVRTAVCCLDREKTPDYVIQVVAVDGGGLKGTGTASIRVADVNDMPPRFVKDEWTTEVDESDGEHLPDHPVLTVTVHDDDENNDFYYRVVDGSGPGADKFNMSRNPDGTGALRVVRPLDYEDQGRHAPLRFRIQVKDTGQDSPDDPYHSAFAWINVKLRDINDNAPVIDRLNEKVQVEEDARVSTILETFRARDLDQRGKSKVVFTVDRSSDPRRLFAVSHDGVVTIQRPLDRETSSKHVIRLIAVDDGVPPLTSTATLTVIVVDVNDNAPTLDLDPDYAPVVMEGEAPRAVAVVTAVDRDNYTAGHGPPFSFLLDPAAPEIVKASFKVDQQLSGVNSSAIITSLRTFDREEQKQYLVPILIQDSGSPRQTGTSTLTVVIGDINDNFMSPGEKDILVYNYMGQMPDAEIGTVWVRDQDDWDAADKTVSWDGPEHRNFRLKEETGMLTLRQGTPPGTYLLKFKVFDRRHVQRDVSANVTVEVREIPHQAVSQASSFRLSGITDQDFIRVFDHNTETRIRSKADLLREKLAGLLGVSSSDVYIVNVRQRSSSPPITDVWYSGHNGRQHYFTAIRLQATALLHWAEIESYVGVNISMVGVNECMDEDRCDGSCTTTIKYGPGTHLVNANCTALSGVQVEVKAECSCGARNFSVPVTCADRPCFNGGHCRQNKYGYRCSCSRGYTGARCQQVARSFRGGGYAWFPPLQTCDSSHLSLEFVTFNTDGQLLYNGPVVPTKPGEQRVSDYISLELTKGNPRLLIDLGSGTLELKIKTKKGLNDGDWHRLDVLWHKQDVTLMVDFCRSADVNETDDGVSSSYDDSSCRVSGVTPNFNERLNLATPLQLGGRLVRELDPTLFQWKAVPYGVGFDGCIRNVFHNSILYDLGSPGLSRGSVAGCPQAEVRCEPVSCAYQGRCEASLREARCVCRPGYTGPACATPTIPAAFKPHSYVKYALSFEPDRYSSQMQLRFRTREPSGELFRTTDQHNKEYAVLEIVDGRLQFKFNLHGGTTSETIVSLANLTVNDGQWHEVNAWRHGCSASLAIDGEEGPQYNETLPTSCSHHWLVVDKQEGVYAGGKAEYTGVRTFEVQHDFHDGCLDDVRLDGRFLPLPPAMNGTQWGQATMARNLDKFCPSSNSCHTAVCPDPFICVDLWHEFECSCGEGRVPTSDGRDCVDENECIDSPCRNGGVCVNQEPRLRYRCLCPAPFLGKNCDVVPERQTVKLGLPALITILASLFFILMIILLLVLYNRRREAVVVKKPRPEDDIRENIISYNDEGGGEDDMTAFDISPLQVPLTTSSTSKTDIIALSTFSEERDWGPSLAACRCRADNDVGAPPFDDLRNYAYEGGDSETGSLSSLCSESDASQQLDQIQQWGPKFVRLAALYKKPDKSNGDEDEENT